MKIKFNDNKEFSYTAAFGLDNDYTANGEKRKSLEVYLPKDEITYSDLDAILSDPEKLSQITLTGDAVTDPETGEILDIPQNIYKGYDIKGPITVDDATIKFKLYKKSDLEIEHERALASIDQLLIRIGTREA
jgi:hypothetical protein